MSNSKKFDISKLQKNYFNASVRNVDQANAAIKLAQNWLLILGLAEMSFLGAIILQSETSTTVCAKGILVTLLLAFVLFILGSVTQYKHLLSAARYYDKLSRNALNKMEQGQQYINKIPEDIKLNREQIKSNKVANIFLFIAFCLVIISTIALILFVLKF